MDRIKGGEWWQTIIRGCCGCGKEEEKFGTVHWACGGGGGKDGETSLYEEI
jgi:hypothetical protein